MKNKKIKIPVGVLRTVVRCGSGGAVVPLYILDDLVFALNSKNKDHLRKYVLRMFKVIDNSHFNVDDLGDITLWDKKNAKVLNDLMPNSIINIDAHKKVIAEIRKK